jgi:hypothetical protein
MRKAVFLWTSLALLALTGHAQMANQVIWVRLDVTEVSGIPLAFTRLFDAEKQTLTFGQEDTLAFLSDLTLLEDTLMGPDCFVPEYKLIYRDHTYVISLYCGKIVSYANSAPFTPSNKLLANPLPFTESLYAYLRKLAKTSFSTRKASPFLIAQVQAGDPLNDLLGELPSLPDEDLPAVDLDMELPMDRPLLPVVEETGPKDDDGLETKNKD